MCKIVVQPVEGLVTFAYEIDIRRVHFNFNFISKVLFPTVTNAQVNSATFDFEHRSPVFKFLIIRV